MQLSAELSRSAFGSDNSKTSNAVTRNLFRGIIPFHPFPLFPSLPSPLPLPFSCLKVAFQKVRGFGETLSAPPAGEKFILHPPDTFPGL